MVSPPTTSKKITSSWSRHASRYMRHACAMITVRIANPRWHSRRKHNPQFLRIWHYRPMVPILLMWSMIVHLPSGPSSHIFLYFNMLSPNQDAINIYLRWLNSVYTNITIARPQSIQFACDYMSLVDYSLGGAGYIKLVVNIALSSTSMSLKLWND